MVLICLPVGTSPVWWAVLGNNVNADEQEADDKRKSFRDKAEGNPSAQALVH